MAYSITVNKEFNSTEVKFDGIPPKEIRNKLKEIGYKWHKTKGVWFGRKTVEQLERILSAKSCEISVKDEPQRKDTDKERKQRKQRVCDYVDIVMKEVYSKSKDNKMREYLLDDIFDIAVLSNGYMVEVEKHSIETSFCFGYGMNGVSLGNEDEDAEKMRQHATTHESYFLEKNMEKVEQYIKWVEGCEDIRLRVKYYNSPENSVVRDLVFIDNHHYATKSDLELPKLTEEDRAVVLEVLNAEKANFKKRLQTYLKRYGLSKLNTWTYLRD